MVVFASKYLLVQTEATWHQTSHHLKGKRQETLIIDILHLQGVVFLEQINAFVNDIEAILELGKVYISAPVRSWYVGRLCQSCSWAQRVWAPPRLGRQAPCWSSGWWPGPWHCPHEDWCPSTPLACAGNTQRISILSFVLVCLLSEQTGTAIHYLFQTSQSNLSLLGDNRPHLFHFTPWKKPSILTFTTFSFSAGGRRSASSRWIWVW